jgi:hypothetical protein
MGYSAIAHTVPLIKESVAAEMRQDRIGTKNPA